jgi:hypothetical protein
MQPTPPPYQDPLVRWAVPVGRSIWAIVAGYLGLFSLLCLPGPLAVAAGIIALNDIRKHPGLGGKGRAIFGIVMGAIGTIGLIAFVVALLTEK